MAAKLCRAVIQRQNEQTAYEGEMRALRRSPGRDMVEVPHEWHTQQTAKAVRFPTYGWVPAEAIRWRHAKTGEILPWSCGRLDRGDAFLIAREFVRAG